MAEPCPSKLEVVGWSLKMSHSVNLKQPTFKVTPIAQSQSNGLYAGCRRFESYLGQKLYFF